MFEPKYRITSYLLNLIDEASYLRSWIETAPLQVSWLPILQKEARAKTAHFSTSIEGNPLTLSQVRAIDRGEKVGATFTQEKEIKNYLQAMKWLENNNQATINDDVVFQLHKIIVKDLLEDEKTGRYKTKQNYVINEEGIRQLTPPSPKETPKCMQELLAWLNNKETRQLHSILVGAIFHHRLVSIHPFPDGNGRLARALGTLILYQREYDLHHIFSLDEFYAQNRKQYYLKLQQARDLDDDLTHWIEYVAEGVVQTLKNVKQRIEGLQVSTSSTVHLSPRQEELLRLLRDNPSLLGADLTKELKVTRSRMNQLLIPLVKSGLVAKIGESRATRYRLNLH